MRIRSRSRHKIAEPLHIEFPSQEDQFQEDPSEVPMVDNQTMAQLLQAPTEGYEDTIVILEIVATNFELKHSLINLVQNKQFFGHDKEDPYAHIRYFNKITSTIRVPNVPNSMIKLMLFPFSLEGAAWIWLEKEPPRSILTWDDLVSKFINQFFPPSKTKNLRNEITRFQQRFDESFSKAWDCFNDLLRASAGGIFLDKMPSDCLKIIESKSKGRQSRAKAVVAKVNTSSSTPAISSDIAELKDMVRALLLDKKNQYAAPAPSLTPAPIKAVEPNCVTCGASPVIVEPLRIELPFLEDQSQEDPPPEVLMADNRTMAELLQASTEGYEDAIVIPEIAANNFELKHGLINLVQNKQFFRHDKEDPHAHIRYFNKITSTMRVPNFFPPSKTINLRNEITRFQQRFDESFYEAWERFNYLLRVCPHHGFFELHQLDTFYNSLNINDQDSLNSAAGGNFLDKMPRECLKIIESKSKVRQSRAKAVVAKVSTSSSTAAISSDVAELKDMVKALLLDKKNQSLAPTPSSTPAPVKAVEPNCVTYGGAHSYQNCPATNENAYRDNIHKPPQQITIKETPVFDLRWLLIKFDLPVFLPIRIIKTISIGDTILIKTEVEISTSLISTHLLSIKANFIDPRLKDFMHHNDGSYIFFEDMNVVRNEQERLWSDHNPILLRVEKIDFGPPQFKFYNSWLSRDGFDDFVKSEWNMLDVNLKCQDKFRRLKAKIRQWSTSQADKENRINIIHEIEKLDSLESMDLLQKAHIKWDVEGNKYYCFLDGFSGYFQILIDPRDQEKTTFTFPYGTFTYRRMPFGLCNALGTFQRCMLAIFYDMVEKTMEVFMDDFSVFGNSFENSLSWLDKMLQRIEVDKAKIDVIIKLPHPTTVKDVKEKLTEAPILIALNWDLPFELMCDASDFAIGAILGQRHEKHFWPIHYASKTLTEAESNYTTTEKEMLVVMMPRRDCSDGFYSSKSLISILLTLKELRT
nr:reverse transcriptase domain-containing protein [Tanacetum cinerariifolium]